MANNGGFTERDNDQLVGIPARFVEDDAFTEAEGELNNCVSAFDQLSTNEPVDSFAPEEDQGSVAF